MLGIDKVFYIILLSLHEYITNLLKQIKFFAIFLIKAFPKEIVLRSSELDVMKCV